MRRGQRVTTIVTGYAAVREDDIELRALQRCEKRIAGIDRQYVAVESASGQRRTHQVRVRGVVFEMEYPQLHFRSLSHPTHGIMDTREHARASNCNM